MSKEVKTQSCPACGQEMRWEYHDDRLAYKGHERTIKTLGWWCVSCGEAILTGPPLIAHEQAFQELKAAVDEVMGPAEVARVRQALGLSQRKAGELLGGGPRAFQKYESGKQAVSLPMSHLLRLLSNDPSRLGEIAADTEGIRRGTQGAGRGEAKGKGRVYESPSEVRGVHSAREGTSGPAATQDRKRAGTARYPKGSPKTRRRK
jgi:HTH-type transcriptional regulator/antitoxin MqsA